MCCANKAFCEKSQNETLCKAYANNNLIKKKFHFFIFVPLQIYISITLSEVFLSFK